MQTFSTASLKVMAVGAAADRICYVLYPLDCLGEWIEEAVQKFGVTIAVITGMDWDNDLTPWRAKGVPAGCPDFRGEAPEFLSVLTASVVPEIEKRLDIGAEAQRTLAGVSLSGLFTLWQWMLDDTFDNIISLSGSFWYEDFVNWIKSRPIPRREGKAFFLLGEKEAKSRVKAFQTVQTDTVEIVKFLHDNGINDCFELVPGDHYQDGTGRLDRAFEWMFRQH